MSRKLTSTTPVESQSFSGLKSAPNIGSVESMSLKNEFWDPLFYDQDLGTSERVFFFVYLYGDLYLRNHNG
jgi:hypothetical protein